MDDISARLRSAVEFLVGNGVEKNTSKMCARMGFSPSAFSNYVTGRRTPSVDVLVTFCNHYPIRLEWLCSGAGGMIKDDRVPALLKKIEDLENRIRELEG